jgi:hypothetical protein
MANFTLNSQANKGKARASSQSFTKRSPVYQPPSQLVVELPRLTTSWSVARTNHNGEPNAMKACKGKASKVFKSLNHWHSNPNKATSSKEQLERKNNGENQLITLRSRSPRVSLT